MRVLTAWLLTAIMVLTSDTAWTSAAKRASFAEVIAAVQPKIVKIYGAGGLGGLEAYQSGLLISAQGHVLTAWSYVLDTDVITVTLDDGRRFQADLVGADPRLEIAVLKVPAEDLPHFKLADAVELTVGDRVLAFSNLFGVAIGDEAASVLHGSVVAKTQLSARRGAFATQYHGPVYVLDAMTNNPGAAGGAVTNRQGALVGLIGKELRNAGNNTWLNHSLPIRELTLAVDDILAGKTRPRSEDPQTKKPAQPWTLALAGLNLVPHVLAKTPPFVEFVQPGSAADKAGLKPDDLILFVNDRAVYTVQSTVEELSFVDRIDPVRLTVHRGQELVDAVLKPVE